MLDSKRRGKKDDKANPSAESKYCQKEERRGEVSQLMGRRSIIFSIPQERGKRKGSRSFATVKKKKKGGRKHCAFWSISFFRTWGKKKARNKEGGGWVRKASKKIARNRRPPKLVLP